MIRVRPLGLVLFIVFVVLGPSGWFMPSDRAAHTQVSNSMLSDILPDASSLGDQPRRGMVDAIETKQGWVVRVEHGGALIYALVVAAGLIGVTVFRLMSGAKRSDDSINSGREE